VQLTSHQDPEGGSYHQLHERLDLSDGAGQPTEIFRRNKPAAPA
jgi:hypothetical protein